MTQVIKSNEELERMSHDNATEKLIHLAPLGPSIKDAAAAVEQEKEFCEDERRLEEEGEIVDFTKCKIREIQALTPVPEKLDPFTEALLSGVDPMSVHHALTLTFPILAFLGHKARVLYSDRKLRWICGQSWQMGGSGSGKSTVLRSLESLFLSKELIEKDIAARKQSAYSQLSEEERKKVEKPQEKLHILDSVPTAIAMLEQMQINGDGVLYLSCTEGGELAKKIGGQYFSIILDMLKKSYDGTGEAFLYKNKEKTFYVSSMKICCNIGGTIDPMYKIFRHCDSDGTLSRGAVIMLGEPKDEETEGAYKDPSWTKEQVKVLLSGAYRLRNFDNRYKEVDELSVDELTSLNQKSNENEKYSESDERVYESAKDDEGCIPTVDEYYFSMQEERVRLALCVPEIISFGKEVKKELRQIGEISSDCCSRANEIAQGMCYLLYIANGLADVPESERDGEYHETLRRIIDVARWWIKMSIDSAISVQTELNANSKSHREEIRMAYKQRAGESATRLIYNEREEVFKRYEAEHAGEIVTAREVRDSSEILQKVVIRTVTRNLQDRGWKEVSRGKWRVPGQKTEEKQ